jgi:hypothetical protein
MFPSYGLEAGYWKRLKRETPFALNRLMAGMSSSGDTNAVPNLPTTIPAAIKILDTHVLIKDDGCPGFYFLNTVDAL